MASAYSLISDAASELLADNAEEARHLILPVLVIPDGVLWVCDYDERGDRSAPTQANHVEFFLEHSPWKMGQMFSYTVSHLHFVTKSGLLDFIARIREDGSFQREMFPEA